MANKGFVGIQEPIQFNKMFDYTEDMDFSLREKVMDKWMYDNTKSDKSEKCDGRVLRRRCKDEYDKYKYYRYQLQKYSVSRGFGFTYESIEEDIEKEAKVVVFKEVEGCKGQYAYWSWEWSREGKVYKCNNEGCSISHDNENKRVVVNVPRENNEIINIEVEENNAVQ